MKTDGGGYDVGGGGKDLKLDDFSPEDDDVLKEVLKVAQGVADTYDEMSKKYERDREKYSIFEPDPSDIKGVVEAATADLSAVRAVPMSFTVNGTAVRGAARSLKFYLKRRMADMGWVAVEGCPEFDPKERGKFVTVAAFGPGLEPNRPRVFVKGLKGTAVKLFRTTTRTRTSNVDDFPTVVVAEFDSEGNVVDSMMYLSPRGAENWKALSDWAESEYKWRLEKDKTR